jgi:hypothetical protein
MENLSEYMELLYETDSDRQNKGASQILELAQVFLISFFDFYLGS